MEQPSGDSLAAEDYYQTDYLRYSNHVYDPLIQSVQLFSEGWDLSLPVYRLNDTRPLKLSFDDLSGELDNLQYTFIHCNANWEPSDLDYSEYINGLPDDFITEYKFSRNTLQKYIHYNLTFPNRNMEFLLSGNYLVKVYQADRPDELVLTWRFMVVEDRVAVVPNIHRATYVEDRLRKQEVDFTLRSNGYALTDPYSDLRVVVIQNSRWDNAITDLRPVFVKGNDIVFDEDRKNVFDGGNEFRNFDTKSIGYRSPEVRAVRYENGENHVYLEPDPALSFRVYLDQPDINGQRLIRKDGNGWDSEVDADYVYVHFTLDYSTVLLDGDLFVFGALTNWDCLPEARLKFNPSKKVYETVLYLKQGYYNYQYAFLQDGKPHADATFTEGTHFQTENVYSILVYHRSIGGRYDKLVSAGTFQYPNNR